MHRNKWQVEKGGQKKRTDLEFTLRGCLDSRLDLLIRRLLLSADDQVDNGDILSRHTESHTSELAIQAGDDLSDGLGSTGGGRNDVAVDGTTTTPVLHRGTIDGLLCCGCRMDGSHQSLKDSELVVDDLCERCKTVRCARRIRDLYFDCGKQEATGLQESDFTYHFVLGVIRIEVHTTHVHRRIGRRRRDNDLLSTALQVSGGPIGMTSELNQS